MNDTEEILWLVNTFGIFGITEEDLLRVIAAG